MEIRRYDAVVLGAGAAGLMCAIEAGRRGKRVAVLEHGDRPGRKILISGGGRCNFTNAGCLPENFLSENPHFARSALSRYTPADFVAWVERSGIRYHEKHRGQLFCDRSASEVCGMLERECARAGVHMYTRTPVGRVCHDGEFTVECGTAGFRAPVLVAATGGLSIPKMGATGRGYDLAREFGLNVVPCRPALVPFTFGPQDRERWADLAGVSVEVTASIGKVSFRDQMLFTHGGLSGPAILQISSYWKPPAAVSIDLAPGVEVRTRIERRDIPSLRGTLRAVLPERLADRWLERFPPAGFRNHQVEDFERALHRWQLVPAGTEGYAKAEVTAGGVDTRELEPKTLESRKVRGLFFIGEVVDVTGHLGGFNFQWAWASGFCAGRAL